VKIVVRPPAAEDVASWQRLGWRSEPDFARMAAEHEAFRALLADAGADVVVAHGEPGNLDSIYVYDPTLATPAGAILLNPGKEARRGEPDALAPDLGVPAIGRLGPGELAEGGDMFWLDDATLAVGLSYRTNDAGVAALRRLLPAVEVLAFDLPHHHGAGEILHLLSLISPLAPGLAVVYLPLLPARLVELLRWRGVELVEVPDDEFATMGPNVLALGARRALAVAGNPETRRRLEHAGVDVRIYEGVELSKGDGGPTCLTLPVDFRAACSS
jgi:N-dimethylarginine dimethylaminohydrolase